MTVSDYIFNFLYEKGCETVYMVSGSSAMWLTDALAKSSDMNVVCCQHEQVCAMAADVYGRVNGVPGVALVTIGPGATNAITGVAEAWLDSSPMFVISGQTNSKILDYQKKTGIRQKGTQSLCLKNMVSDITKFFVEIMDPSDTKYYMEKAYYEAMNGRKGPVWIDVPVDIQNKQVTDDMRGYEPEEENLKVDETQWNKIQEWLEASNKPLILAGSGVLSAGVREELLSFAGQFDIPIVTSRNGIGVISSDKRLYVGRPGAYGDRASHFAIQECDFLLILGSRLAQSMTGYYPNHLAPNAKKIMVDIDDKELSKGDVSIDVSLNVDLKDFVLAIINKSVCWKKKPHSEWINHCNDNKKKYPTVLSEYTEEEGVNSYYFTKVLSENTPDNNTIVVDTGSVCNIVSQSWLLKQNQKYIISGGLSCMGFWAGAIGASARSNSVIALSGDGSTQMNIQDFATLAYYKLPVKLFVYNNRGYMLIRHNQHNYMDDRFLGVGPDSGVPTVDFCAIAMAYGLRNIRIDNKQDIEDKVREVFEVEGPVICEVMVQEFGIIAPRIASRVMPDGSLKAAEFDDLWPFLDENK